MGLSLPQMLQALIKLFRGVRKDHFVIVLMDNRLWEKEGGREGGYRMGTSFDTTATLNRRILKGEVGYLFSDLPLPPSLTFLLFGWAVALFPWKSLTK